MSLEIIDLIIVAGYALALIGIATWVSREKAGHEKNTEDYFLAGKALPWWAIGASLIAANISAEQIIGMSGSGFAIGMAIASYEWMAAITLIIVGKFFLPIFLKRGIYTMPQFLESRFGSSVKYVMSVFWLVLYTVVNLTTVLWLGATAINTLTDLSMFNGMLALAAFAAAYSIYGGLKAVALTDIIQVVLLIFGGALITWIVLGELGGDAGAIAGFNTLVTDLPERFDMIIDRETRPEDFQNLPGIGVLIGGMWIMNLSYWGFNQYIIQRALGARDIKEAQRGVLFAAFLKLIVPFIVVIPGIAAVMLAPDIGKPDQAYPTMMTYAPVGIRGLIFAALVAAIVSSVGSMMNSISTIFTMDLYKPLLAKDAPEKRLVMIGRIASFTALVIAVFLAQPLLGASGQVFQNIQNWTGFVTPGVCAIFFLGMFWKRATEIGGLAAVIASGVLSFAWPMMFPDMPFMNRVGFVFLLCLGLGMLVSYLQKPDGEDKVVRLGDISFKTGPGFNIGAVIVTIILIVLYAVWW
ncbi:sodium/solute symporter [Parvularcula flava]|uniref:Sodium transporter n=1 Tax=Aquisalinus luteolus TaxID=1566827 RepID=A0A8J3A0K2_9PROT|nr:sodium/sugar symporter [Aquisalinus luteolus]NHK26821.1 sodium/solute symporter [Aquisalinus luteolus]GGH93514.1 sodium transporter [Aquisalinus luteolus]